MSTVLTKCVYFCHVDHLVFMIKKSPSQSEEPPSNTLRSLPDVFDVITESMLSLDFLVAVDRTVMVETVEVA